MPVVGHEEHVLRLEIGVGQLVVVHEPDRVAQLVGDVPHLLEGVSHVRVALQEVEDRLAENFEGEAHVAKVVEVVVHSNAQMLALRILCVQLLQDVDLQLGRFTILVNVLDDLQGDVSVGLEVTDPGNLSKRPFAERRKDLVPFVQNVSGQVCQMPVCVVCNWRPLSLEDWAAQRGAIRLERAV